jgi:uncharacterized protein YjbI with pentapeptide repeats
MAAEELPWKPCRLTGCIGVKLPVTAWCLAHAAERAPEAFDAELNRIGQDGTIDARGVPISDELLGRILDAVPHQDGRPTFTAVAFDRATFQGTALFSRVTFKSDAEFDGATFQDWAWFAGVTFQGTARFNRTTFRGGVEFFGATFRGLALFDGATFQAWPWFSGADFQREARFIQATF